MKTYNIIVLGPSGAGKTVFMASMYKRLAIQGADTGFFIETDFDLGIRLNRIYRQVVDPEDEWPAPTQRREISEWPFLCSVEADDGQKYQVLQFNYLDYAGERLTDSPDSTAVSQDFAERLRRADALLGMLDGHKVLALMREEPKGHRFLQFEIASTLTTMQHSDAPIHFVVTKWDLLDAEYSLAQVRERLLEEDSFRELIALRSRSSKSPVRLIPVSSVGMGFAEPRPDGSMRKNPRVAPKPFHVEIPLVAVLPDQFHMQYQALNAGQKAWIEREVRVGTKLSHLDRLGLVAGLLVRIGMTVVLLVHRGLFGEVIYRLDKAAVDDLVAWLQSGARTKREQAVAEHDRLTAEREESIATISDQQAAIAYTRDRFLRLLKEMEWRYPESILSSRPDGMFER